MKTTLSQVSQIAFAFIMGFLNNADAVHSTDEDGVIKIHLSYKIILNPKNQCRPSLNIQVGEKVSDNMIREAVDEMNELMAATWRGYRFALCEIQEIGALGGAYPDPKFFRQV